MPPGKYYKCRAYINKYQANIPYTVKRTVTFSDNTKISKTIKTQFEGIMSSSIKFDRCCFQNCVEGKDKLCPDAVKVKTTACPKIENQTDATPESPKTEVEKIPQEIDFELITDIKVTVGKTTSCPNGYIAAMCFDIPEVCDFQNSKLDSNDIHICLKKQKLSKVDNLPINAIKINRINNDCGILEPAKVSLNQNDVFLCFGNDSIAPLAPIIDVVGVRHSKDLETARSKGFICDEIEILNDMYLCYMRNINAPKRVEIKDFVYDTVKMKKHQVGTPNKVNEIVVSSSSVSVTVKATKRTESSLKKSFDFGVAVGVGITGSLGIYEVAATLTGSYKRVKTNEVKESSETTESSTLECSAPEGKKVKCVSSMLEYKVTIPYTAKLVSYDYEGKEMINFNREITGTFEGVNSGNINIRSCCLEGCCTGEVDETNKRSYCDGINKDVLCSELDSCFVPSANPAKRLKRKRRLY